MGENGESVGARLTAAAGIEACYERSVQLFGAWSIPLARVLAAVFVGGAIGATGRWAVSEVIAADEASWAWATLIVNVAGALAIGLAARRIALDSLAWAFVVTGVLGGFTTFSALAVQLNDLVEADRTPMAVLYGAVTLGAGVGATLLAGGRRRRSEERS